jgi:hypothetical protein
MSYKSQFFPPSSTCEAPLRQPIGHLWGSAPASSSGANVQDMDMNMKVLRSWLVYDSDLQTGLAPRRVTWNMVLGLALATAVSASIWAGVGLMIASLWK